MHTRVYKTTQSGRHSSSGRRRSTPMSRRKYDACICRTTSVPASPVQAQARERYEYRVVINTSISLSDSSWFLNFEICFKCRLLLPFKELTFITRRCVIRTLQTVLMTKISEMVVVKISERCCQRLNCLTALCSCSQA